MNRREAATIPAGRPMVCPRPDCRGNLVERVYPGQGHDRQTVVECLQCGHESR